MMPQVIVASMYHQYALYFRIFSDAHARTTVTDDMIRIAVFIVPTGTLSNPCGHMPGGESILRKMYAEKSPPKSITSDARKSQIPIFAFQRPVSGRLEIVYGISMTQKAGIANPSASPVAEGERIEVRGLGHTITRCSTLTLPSPLKRERRR